jgi:hypothetical protein
MPENDARERERERLGYREASFFSPEILILP